MSWPQVPLGEVSMIVTGKTPSTKDEANFGGDIPFVTPAELDAEATILSTPRTLSEIGAASIKLVPKNAVLVGCIGTLGKVGMAGKPLATNQQINAVVFDEAKIWPRFGYYAAKRLRPEMEMMAPATTVKIISKSKFSELTIPHPPLDEQKRIAGILDQADALRRLRTRALDKLNTLGQAIFHEMFVGNSQITRDWKRLTLDELIFENDRINYGVVQPGDHDAEGVPIIRVADLAAPTVDFESVKRISRLIDASYSRSRLKGGEILIGCVGSIGSTMIAPPEFNGANIARAVARVPVDPQKCDPRFVAEYIKSDIVQRYFQKEVRLVAQPTLNIKQIRETEVVVPPVELQQDFLSRISLLDSSKNQVVEGITRTDDLFTSLQHRAFRGEL